MQTLTEKYSEVFMKKLFVTTVFLAAICCFSGCISGKKITVTDQKTGASVTFSEDEISATGTFERDGVTVTIEKGE